MPDLQRYPNILYQINIVEVLHLKNSVFSCSIEMRKLQFKKNLFSKIQTWVSKSYLIKPKPFKGTVVNQTCNSTIEVLLKIMFKDQSNT